MQRREKTAKFVVLILLAIIFVLFYQNSKLTHLENQIGDIDEKRLKLIEDKFGGEKSLKCSESETVKKVRSSIVRVIGGEAEGSGFVINDDGIILTNFHLIEFEPSPKVILPDNSFETAEILMADKNADLAIIKINKNLPVISWGDPKELNGVEYLQTYTTLTSGVSGEPMINICGEVSLDRIEP